LGPHPCLERVALETKSELTLTTAFTRVRHWILGEHVVRGGEALIPGTGHMELIRAAAVSFGGGDRVTLEGITFLRPFAVAEGESRELFLRLRVTGERRASATIFSESEDDPHVTGAVRF